MATTKLLGDFEFGEKYPISSSECFDLSPRILTAYGYLDGIRSWLKGVLPKGAYRDGYVVLKRNAKPYYYHVL